MRIKAGADGAMSVPAGCIIVGVVAYINGTVEIEVEKPRIRVKAGRRVIRNVPINGLRHGLYLTPQDWMNGR